MDEKTAAALEASIEHWKRNASVDNVDDAHLGPGFWLKDCEGCPVREKTGLEACAGTPFDDAYQAWRDCMNMNGPGLLDRFKRHAQREVEFLESLRSA